MKGAKSDLVSIRVNGRIKIKQSGTPFIKRIEGLIVLTLRNKMTKLTLFLKFQDADYYLQKRKTEDVKNQGPMCKNINGINNELGSLFTTISCQYWSGVATNYFGNEISSAGQANVKRIKIDELRGNRERENRTGEKRIKNVQTTPQHSIQKMISNKII